jgi:hypothetical protein
MGAILGAVLSTFFFGIHTLVRGFPASREGLELAGLHVSGTLSKNPATNLPSLRKLVAYMTKEDHPEGASLLLCKGKGYCFGEELKELLQKNNRKVFLINCTAEDIAKEENVKTLAQFLDDESISEAFEVLTSKKFRLLLPELKKRYEWIITIVNEAPGSVEAEILLSIFDYAAFIISGETNNQLYHLIQTIKKECKENVTTFLITEEI